ncbi:uncharacterized protein [Diadema antillarum]|uniref:uncharacterized protein n=1 Tax=Diadema antillarum TaxID=105358 RepID=UPI003A8BB0BF
MALLNSSYSLQQGFYTAGVFPAPLSSYSGFSLVGLRMQPSFGALSTATMGQLAGFPGGSAAAVAAATSFSMENLRAVQGLRPMAGSNRATSPEGCGGDKRSSRVTDFSIDGILGKRDINDGVVEKLENIRVKHKIGRREQHGTTNNKSYTISKDYLDRSDSITSKGDEDEDDMKPDTDVIDNPMARFSWLQCTRYKPPRLPRTKRKDGTKKRKLGRNPRVPFSPTQVATLEQKFRCTHYLSSIDVAELSTALNLSENRVKIWFQNRRARERRDKEGIDSKAQPSAQPNLLPSSPAAMAHSPHAPISPMSSSSPSSSLSTLSPFAAPSTTSLTTPIMLPRMPSPRSSIENASPSHHLISSSGSLSSTSTSISSSHQSVLIGESSPRPLMHQPHHLLSLASSTDPEAVSAFTPVSPSVK